MTAAPIVLLTRPKEASDRFAARLAARWPELEVVIAPLQEVRYLDWVQPKIKADALIFTSQNAVAAAVRAGLQGPAYCVGNQTADLAAKAGFVAISAEGESQALVARIGLDGPRAVWHLRGRDAAGDVTSQLRKRGFAAFEAVVYEMVDCPADPKLLAHLKSDRPVLLPLFSPESARRAAAALQDIAAPLAVLALSDAVARAARGINAGLRLVAKRPDADGMLEIVEEALNSGALS